MFFREGNQGYEKSNYYLFSKKNLWRLKMKAINLHKNAIRMLAPDLLFFGEAQNKKKKLVEFLFHFLKELLKMN